MIKAQECVRANMAKIMSYDELPTKRHVFIDTDEKFTCFLCGLNLNRNYVYNTPFEDIRESYGDYIIVRVD